MKVSLCRPCVDDLARHRVRERDVGADVEPEPAVGPLRGRRAPRVDREQPRAVAHALRGRGGRRSDASRGRSSPRGGSRPSPRPHGRTTCRRPLRTPSPDRRRWERVKCGCRSRCCSCPSPGARTSGPGSSSRSSPSSTRTCRTRSWRPGRARCENRCGGEVERLVPGGGAEGVAVADERRGEATRGLGHSGFLPTLAGPDLPPSHGVRAVQGSARRLRARRSARVSASARSASGTSSVLGLTPRSDSSPPATRRSSSGSSRRG